METFESLAPNYVAAIALIDEVHAADPTTTGDPPVPYELHYARKMTRWLAQRKPDASPELQLACRAQHFRRWELPRSTYPMTRAGYLTWRAKQKTVAATNLAALLSTAPGIAPPLPEATVARIAALVRKEGLSSGDEEAQALEDVACLVFLDDQFDGFEEREDIDEEKIIAILRKTWAKMGEEGRRLAVGMELSERAGALVKKALEGA